MWSVYINTPHLFYIYEFLNNKLYSKEEFKKLQGIDLVHSPNYKTQESTIKKNSKKKAHIDKKNINRINNNLKYGFQIIKGLGRNHNKRKYSRFS